MTFDKLKQTETYKQFVAAMLSGENMEFWVLKAQIYIEYRLKHLLALRLGVPAGDQDAFIKQFENINYHHLVLLALAGPSDERLRANLIKLNNVRKEVAHRFQVTDYLRHLQTFVEAISRSRPWPSSPEDQASAVRVALAVVITLVEFHIRDIEEPGWSDDSEP